MRRLIFAAILCLATPIIGVGTEKSPGRIHLLDGYTATRGSAVDAAVWTIQGKSGLIIHFESGPSEGRAVNLRDREKYAWYRKQTVNGQEVLVALIKPGLKTVWEPDPERNLPPGNILLVTFPLSSSHPDSAANFVAKLADEQEMADVLLMTLTFDPSRGGL